MLDNPSALFREARARRDAGCSDECVELCTRCLGTMWGWPETVAWRSMAIIDELNDAVHEIGKRGNPDIDCPWTFLVDAAPVRQVSDEFIASVLRLRASCQARLEVAVEDYSAALYFNGGDQTAIEGRGIALGELGDIRRAKRDAARLRDGRAVARVLESLRPVRRDQSEARVLRHLETSLPTSAIDVKEHAILARTALARASDKEAFRNECSRRAICSSDDPKILAMRAAFVEEGSSSTIKSEHVFSLGPMAVDKRSYGSGVRVFDARALLDDDVWRGAIRDVDDRARADMMRADEHRCAPDQFVQIFRRRTNASRPAVLRASPDLSKALALLSAVVTQMISDDGMSFLESPGSVPVMLARYPPGAGYAMHKDVYDPQDPRYLSCLLYLNDLDDNSGEGSLRIHSNKCSGGAKDIAPLTGRIVVFDSQTTWHEVLPSTRSRRVLTLWLNNRSAETPKASHHQHRIVVMEAE